MKKLIPKAQTHGDTKNWDSAQQIPTSTSFTGQDIEEYNKIIQKYEANKGKGLIDIGDGRSIDPAYLTMQQELNALRLGINNKAVEKAKPSHSINLEGINNKGLDVTSRSFVGPDFERWAAERYKRMNWDRERVSGINRDYNELKLMGRMDEDILDSNGNLTQHPIHDKPLELISPEFDLITMGSVGKDLFKFGKNLLSLRKMPVSYTGVPEKFVADFMEYEPRGFYTRESEKVVKELAEKGITPEDQNTFFDMLINKRPEYNNWAAERGRQIDWELSPDKQKIVGYKGDNTPIYTSDDINLSKAHLKDSPGGKIFKIYDKGTGKEFHIKSPKEEFGVSDHSYYGEPWYEWDKIPVTIDPYTQKIVKTPIDNWEFGKVVPANSSYTTTSGLMSGLKNLGYSQLKTDRVNLNYPGYPYPITERIYTTAKDIIKAPFEEPMWQTALRTSNIDPYSVVANGTLGTGNILYDYTK